MEGSPLVLAPPGRARAKRAVRRRHHARTASTRGGRDRPGHARARTGVPGHVLDLTWWVSDRLHQHHDPDPSRLIARLIVEDERTPGADADDDFDLLPTD